jgi:hypothetical protein
MKVGAPPSAAPPHRFQVYLGCTLLVVVVNYLLGKDMASDALSYHLYAGFSAVHDRFAQDYFPAGPQSYFNPYIYVPLYYLAKSSLSSLEIASILAIVHSIILWLTYELAVAICPWDDRHRQLRFGLCAVVFALINPILLQQMGSTFADVTTGEFVLAGWLLLAREVRAPSRAGVVYAGLLCGMATGLKLTNAVHAMAGFALLIMLPLTLRGRIRHGLAYGVSLGIAFLAIAAPWSYRLDQRFGNPVFPLMNSVFRSPEFTTEPGRALRFVPATIGEALWRPFAMIDPVRMVHDELRAPDLRYALIVMLTGALVGRWLWRRWADSSIKTAAADVDAASTRTLAAVGCGLAVDWVAWLNISGNSRYFLPMSCVAAVVAVGLLYRLLPTQRKARNYILAVILGIQGVQLWMGTDYRWNQTAWDERWINIEVPAKLKSVPSLYLTMGTPTNSFIAPYLDPGAGLVNFFGLYTLSPEGASGARIRSLVNRYAPNLRMLIGGERLYGKDERRSPNKEQIDDALGPFALRVDESDCATITVHGLPSDPDIIMASSLPQARQARDTTYLLSCRVVADNTDYSAYAPARRSAGLALDHLEDACPAVFQPRRPSTEYSGEKALRRYGGSDLIAWVSNGGLKFRQTTGGDAVYLGRKSDWARAPLGIQCGRRNGRFFVIQSTN